MVLSGESHDTSNVEVLTSCLFGGIAAGFYIVWGCLVWVPSVYTSPALYLVNHPVELGTPVHTLTLFVTCHYLQLHALGLEQSFVSN